MSRQSHIIRPDERAPLVVICSGTSWDGPRLSDRHLAERLTAYADVLFVDPPISVLTPLRRPSLARSATRPGLRRLGPHLHRLTPIAPPGVSRPGLRRVALEVTRVWMRWAAHRLGGDVEAVIAGSLDDVFGACRERQSVLWGTDDFASAGELMGLSPSWLARRERDQLRKSTAIVTVSEELAQRWRARGHDVTVIANGCDAGHYAHLDRAPPPVDVRLKRPIAGFVGHLSDRIDLDLLEALARSGHALLLVGPRQSTFHIQRLDRLLALPNVQWAGPKPFSELPSYLSVIDVGITPYTDTPFNRSSFPLKTLEYLAAGRPVVTTDLPAARGLATELVTIAADAEDFARATSELLTSPRPPDFVERAQAFARRHDWSERTRDMARLLGLKHLGR